MPKKPEAQIGPELVVGRRIRQERQARDWTLDTLSRKLLQRTGTSVPPSALSLVENGKRRITLNEALAYAALFEVTLEQLLDPQSGDLELQHAVANTWAAINSLQRWKEAARQEVYRLMMLPTRPTGQDGDDVPQLTEVLGGLVDVSDPIDQAARLFDAWVQQRTPALWAQMNRAKETAALMPGLTE